MLSLLHQKQVLPASLFFRARNTHHFLFVQTVTLLLSFFLLAATSYQANGQTCPTIIFPDSLPSNIVGDPYTASVAVVSPVGKYTYTLVPEDEYPIGLDSMTGQISGQWSYSSDVYFVVRATDANGCYADKVYTIKLNCPKVTITPPKNGRVGERYEGYVGNNRNYYMSIRETETGKFPEGLYNGHDGYIFGTPTKAGTYTLGYYANEPMNGCEAEGTFTIIIEPAATQPVNQADSLALVDLYNSAGGVNWENWESKLNWLTGKVNTWDGVVVEGDRVISLDLRTNKLIGTLPSSLGNLSALRSLALANNQLSGSIPASIGNLTALTKLELNNNKLTGSIPASIGNLTALNQLALQTNQLTGSIPTSIGNLTALSSLSLDANQLSGVLPESITDLTGLTYLSLGNNQLEGSIPASIDHLTKLYNLDLSNNKLTGSIPASIGNLPSLLWVYLSNNQLSGTIPATIENLKRIEYLYLSNNQLTGSIASFGSMKTLVILHLSHNQFSGSITSVESLRNLANLNLSHNQFSGTIPAAISNNNFLSYLDLSNNQLSGTIPASIGLMTAVSIRDFSNNQLTGSFSTLGYAFYIKKLNLSHNQLTGLPVFPTQYTDKLEVQNNQLTFESLEPNSGRFITPSYYSPQDSVGVAGKQSLAIGGSLTLSSLIGGKYNQYQWTKNGVDILGATNANFTLSATSVGDQGWYSCKVTNTVIHSLTIHRRRVFVQVTPATTGCTASGSILRETWVKVAGYDVRTIPVNTLPTATRQLTRFEGPSNVTNNYGDRISGYICPPVSGNYTFWIASDDNGVLYLSSTDQPASKQRIAWVNGTTKPQEWTKFASQQSAPIYLQAGKKYYIESLHKEVGGDDHIAVGWQLPGGALERPIPGKRLSPFINPSARLADSAKEELEQELASIATLSAAPNPFADQTTIHFTAQASGKASVAVYDLNGSLVKVLFEGELEEGESKELILEGAALSSGVYLVKATSPVGVDHLKVVLTK